MKHVVFFRNGESYEDARETPVCIAPNGNVARFEVKWLTAWLKAKQEEFPITQGVDEDKSCEWLAAEDKRRERIERIRCPHGHGAIRYGILYHIGHFYALAVPDIK